MNIHPLIVHFPIALLTVYAVLELLQFSYFKRLPYWFYLKAVFVILGSGASMLAFVAGELAEDLLRAQHDQFRLHLANIHSRWATATVAIFGIIALFYALAWISRSQWWIKIETALRLNHHKLFVWLKRLVNYLVSSPIMLAPALIGLACLLVTGALGGAIVYGPGTDPFVRFIYQLLIGS